MNTDNNHKRQEPVNGHISDLEQRQADQFVEALETEDRLVGSLDAEAQQIAGWGAGIRQLADEDLPAANENLRESLLEKLDGQTTHLKNQPSKRYQAGASIPTRGLNMAWLSFAMCLLLVAALIVLNLPANWLNVQLAGVQLKGGVDNVGDLDVDSIDQLPSGYYMQDDVQYDQSGEFNARGAVIKGQIASIAAAESPGKNVKSPSEMLWFDSGVNIPNESPAVVLPKISGQTATTTYTVPDGGTVLLGGVKTPSDANDNLAFFNHGSAILTATKDGDGVQSNGSNGVALKSGTAYGLAFSKPLPFGDESKDRNSLHEFRLANLSDLYALQAPAQPSNETYQTIHENKFVAVDGQQALSTFSIDVDTASYANMRRFLNNNQRPPANAIRIEELVNYFDYDYQQPDGDSPFSVNMELASCPWNEQHHLLRVGLQGKEIPREERSASNLVFLLDVSGSMQSADKLPLLKKGLNMLVRQLSENDTVSIVTYAGNAGVALNPTNGENKPQIEKAIENLNAGGSTNGSAGINLAYELAQKHFIKDGVNRVILATDGDLNVGVTDDNGLVGLIKQKSSEGVFLTVLGFGTGNLKDSKLEKLADNGNGMYAYIDSFREAHKVLIEQMSGSLETIAKDVKIQIELILPKSFRIA